MKFIYSFLALSVLVLFTSCEKNEAPIFTGEFLQMEASEGQTYAYPKVLDGDGVPSGFEVILVGSLKSNAVNYQFEIDPSSTAIENLHYTVDATSGTIPANSARGTLPITILDDNINPGEELTIVVTLTSADVEIGANYATGTHTVTVLCSSDIVTSYDYTHTDNFAGETLTGSGQLTRFGTSETQYLFSDFSFGAWEAAYGIDPPGGNLRFTENCGMVGITGTDNYGDSWSLVEVIESNGPDFTFRWENTYGEFGTVTLTRTDGNEWPTFIN